MSPRKSQITILRQYFEFSTGIVVATAFAVLKVPRLIELYNADFFYGINASLLFIVTCMWLGGWIYFDQKEIQLLEEYVETRKVERLKSAPFLAAIFIGVLSGLLLGLSDQPRFYIIVALINWIFSAIGAKLACDNFKQLSKNDETYKTGIPKLICEYYLLKPFFLLDYITFAFLIIALTLGWAAFFTNNRFDFYLSYVITILTVLAHEGILWKWRVERDKLIDKIEVRSLAQKKA